MEKIIKAVIFDAEGVVINTEPLWDRSQIILMERRGLVYNRAHLKPLMAGRTILEGVRVMKDYYNLDEDENKLANERKELIENLFLHDIAYIDGFNDFFEWLETTDLKSCIATSLRKKLMILVEQKLPVRDLFGNAIFHIEDVGSKSKPAPDIFLYAAREMGIAPENCIVIEDSPYGIEAAKSAGMISIGLTTSFDQTVLSEADNVVSDYVQIRHLLSNEYGISCIP
jgi:beta-phosphoglucomutase-like phosphatase (HAD superfamily)